MNPNATGLFSTTAFQGKIIGVTGAASGIGKSMTDLFTHMGASVFMMDRNLDRLEETEALFKSQGKDVHAVPTDVSKWEDLENAVKVLREKWGRLDGWVNNAGVNAVAPISEQPEEAFRNCWEINTLAAWRSLKLTHDLFPKVGGAIVNISSILGSHTRPGNMAYASSKAALEGLTRAMAIEFAPRRLRVNCIIPGNIRVQPTVEELQSRGVDYPEYFYLSAKLFDFMAMYAQPIRPNSGPEDIANMAAMLLSDACPFMTGESLIIDGGLNVEMRSIIEYTSQEMLESIVPAIQMRERRDQLKAEAIARGDVAPNASATRPENALKRDNNKVR
jgi:NAD(P)-dependent dehydrogenase (short-subunit alcohol dehydrogenase family)